MKKLPEIPKIVENSVSAFVELNFEEFRSLVFEGAKKHLLEVNDAILDRLIIELDLIKEHHLLPYFGFWLDIHAFCREQNILYGPGRGTINALLVAKCLGISVVNPLEWNLQTERFFNPINGETPAFSMDVSFEKRDQIIAYLKSTYGIGHIAAFTERSEEEVSGAPNKVFTPFGSGLIMSATPILPTVPTLKMRDSGQLVVDFPSKYLQNLGCVKFDIHGLKYLDHLQQMALDQDELFHINWDDAAVYQYIIQSGDKEVFPFHTDSIRQLLNDFQPENLEELALIFALHRPGLIDYASGMLRLRNEDEDAYFPHETLYKPLLSTYGYLVYKEQFNEVVSAMSGLSPEEAAEMNRVLLEDDRSNDYASRFIEQSESNGIPMDTIQQVMTELIASHPFLYSKSHAIGAVMIGYTIAYHKVKNRED